MAQRPLLHALAAAGAACLIAAALAGCAGATTSGAPPGGTPVGAATGRATGTAGGTAATGAMPWDPPRAGASQQPTADGPDSPTSTSDDVALGAATADLGSLPKDPNAGAGGPEAVDPCTLITAREWADWTREAPSAPISLEGGEACGWTNAADTFRLAIGAFDRAGDEGFVSSQEAAALKAQSVPGLGDRAIWLAHWPVSQSSTLVVTRGGVDLVIELSRRDGSTGPDLLEAARHFATIALGRLP